MCAQPSEGSDGYSVPNAIIRRWVADSHASTETLQPSTSSGGSNARLTACEHAAHPAHRPLRSVEQHVGL